MPLSFPHNIISVTLQDRDWSEYWRLLFKKVTLDDIRTFEKSYKGSEEEAETLKSAYLDCEGDMERIMEEVNIRFFCLL